MAVTNVELERDVRIGLVLEEALQELREHGRVGVAGWQARYPELAAELPGLLDTLRDLDCVVEDCRDTSLGTEAEDVARPGAAEQPMPEQIGRYRLLERLGAGGMGTVWKAHDPELDRIVAVKVPRFDRSRPDYAAAVQRFVREGRAAAKVLHPNVCPIYDAGEYEGAPYAVMACIEGPSLAARLSEATPTVARAVELIRKVALALEAVHARGIIHRDLKPANVLLDPSGEPLLTDFGLARPMEDGEHITQEGMIVGTPAYLAPEQASGQNSLIGPATDVYSLGVMLFQMLTGRLPFEGPLMTILYQTIHGEPPTPRSLRPDLDAALEGIVLKAMAKKPDGRYPTARAFAEALGEWRAPAAVPTGDSVAYLPTGDSVAYLPTGECRKPEESPRRWRKWPWLAAAAAVLLALLPLGYFFAPAVIRIATNKGVLVVEADDASIEVKIKGEQVTIINAKSKREFTLTAGKDHEIEVRELPDGVAVATRTFRLKRNGKEVVNARIELAKKDKFKVGFNATGRMVMAHGRGFTLTLLPDGRVLAVGGNAEPDGFRNAAESWDPRSGTWSVTGPMHDARSDHSATLLPDGRVLVAGGRTLDGELKSVEIYDADSGTWSVHAPLATARARHTAVLLQNGKLLVAAGATPGQDKDGKKDTLGLASTELYDLRGGSWSPSGSLNTGRMDAIGVLLEDGRVLIAGGIGKGVTLESFNSVEIYDPGTATWKYTGKMAIGRRADFALTTLRGGKVLVAGGGISWTSIDTDKAEVYNPATALWSPTSPMPTTRQRHTATLLADETILVAGGLERPVNDKPGTSLNTALIYHPIKKTWSPTTNALGEPRDGHQAVRLQDGSVMLAGGYHGDVALRTAEVFVPTK